MQQQLQLCVCSRLTRIHLAFRKGIYTRLSAGLELAQAMAVFGSQVTVIERGNHIMGREDPDAAAIVHRQMEKDGVHFMLSTSIEEFRPDKDGKVAAHVVQNGIKVGLTTAVTVRCMICLYASIVFARELSSVEKIAMPCS